MGDCFFVDPDTFDQIEEVDAVKPEVPAYVAKSRFHKGGANWGLRALEVAKLLSLQKTQGQVRYTVPVTSLTSQRPERLLNSSRTVLWAENRGRQCNLARPWHPKLPGLRAGLQS